MIFLPNTAVAESNTITVAPAIIEIAAKPGDVVTRTITIQNGGEQSLPISLEAQSIIRGRVIGEQPSQRDASDWISFDEEIVVFEPQQREQIPVNIKVPDDADSGGHYAQISVRGLTLESTSEETSSIVIPEVAISVLITIAGEIKESVAYSNVSLSPWQTTPNSGQQMSFTITNTGNVHGIITPNFVLEKDGNQYYNLSLGSQVVLPGESITINQEWTTPSSFGRYSTSIQTKFGSENQLFSSDKERLIVSPSITTLFVLAVLVWSTLFYLHNKTQIKRAINILIKGEP